MFTGSPLLSPLRSRGARRALFLMPVAILCAAPAAAVLGAGGRPNIVLIMSDDAGYNEFGFTSALTGQSTQFETPNLDALALESVIARQGYVVHPLCSPSRAGLLTGQYPQRFGFEGNLSTSWSPAVPDTTGLTLNNRIMAQHLKELGYTTGMVGKWHLGYQDNVNLPTDKGFDEFYGLWGGGRTFWFGTDNTMNLAHIARRGEAVAETASKTQGDPAEYDPLRGRYVTDAFGDEAVAFINDHANEGNPFFLYLAMTAPHTPLEAKQSDFRSFCTYHRSDGSNPGRDDLCIGPIGGEGSGSAGCE
jgi:arylsulfatase A-like enzyme